ncbi:MAG: hypothetical protein PHQ96_05495 [Candidatus Omnitrophica bacterium]|nr:hypothetical protein [Candidatus Omnitrophota bacterium]
MKDNISPEERLLRLIKGSKKQPQEDGDTKLAQSAPITPKVKPQQKSIKKYKAFFANVSQYLTIRRVIFFALMVSSGYLIFSFIYPCISPKKIEVAEVATQSPVAQKTVKNPGIKPFEFYQQGIINRRVFDNYQAVDEGKPANIATADLIKDMKLVGIISGANPQAVIEDGKTERTFYLNKGQSIDEFLLDDIQEGKIILNYKGERYELYL